MDRKTKREIRSLIKEEQANGQTDEAIYHILTKEYKDKKNIAELIVTTVKPSNKKRHYAYTGILLGFMAIVLFFNIWIIGKSPYPFFADALLLSNSFQDLIKYLTFFYGSPLLSYAIIFSVICKKQITPYVFWMCTSSFFIFYYFALWAILEKLWLYMVIDLLSILAIILLAYFFQRKIFPNYRYWRLKRNEDGDYLY